MNKKHIETFETIYGVDIIVANKYVTLDELRDIMTYADGYELEEEPSEYEAYTSTCKYKSTGRYCILVRHIKTTPFKDEKMRNRLINCAAHEALHVMINLQAYSNQKIDVKDSCEYLAYFMGWMTERIYDTWTKK